MALNHADQFMMRLTEGLISWLSYQQVLRRSAIYSEYLTYSALYEMAVARSWKAYTQHKLPDGSGKSGPKTPLDFVFIYTPDSSNRGGAKTSAVAPLEVKFIKGRQKFTGDILKDLAKLHRAEVRNLGPRVPEPDVFERYFMLIGPGGRPIEELRNADQGGDLVRQIEAILDSDENSRDITNGWVRNGYGPAEWRFQAFVLRCQGWWGEIRETEASTVDAETSLDSNPQAGDVSPIEEDELADFYNDDEVQRLK